MNILILCTGNSCRSQMAAGWLRHLAPAWEVASAGTQPSNQVHPLAVQVMAEVGIDLSQQRPLSVNQFINQPWDLVWTVCGGAQEACPVFAGVVTEKMHLGFDDPAGFTGPPAQVLAGFRQVRDEIQTACINLIRQRDL